MTSVLQQAQDITTGGRRRDYGHPLYNFVRIALRWSARLEITVTPSDVAWMMIEMKSARDQNTPKYDNVLDAVGYAACLQEMALELVKLGRASSEEDGYRVLDNMSVQCMHDILTDLKK